MNTGKKRILAFGDSNTWGWTALNEDLVARLDKPWPAVLEEALGNQAEVISEGLGGRTTEVDRPLGSGLGFIEGVSMNGAAYLPACLASCAPLAWVIIFLGTNDMQSALNRSSEAIAQSLARLVKIVKEARWQHYTEYEPPQVLVICPPRLQVASAAEKEKFAGAAAKSEMLASLARPLVLAEGAAFIDAHEVVGYARQSDDIHLDAAQHRRLGLEVAQWLAPRL